MHEKINDLLPDYVNGLLPEGVKNLVERHVSECARCAEEVDLLKGIHEIEAPDPGPEFWAACPKAAVSAAGKSKSQISNFNSRIKYILPPAAAAALLFGFWLHGVYKGGHSQDIAQVNFQDPLSSEFSSGQAAEIGNSPSDIGQDVDAEIGEDLSTAGAQFAMNDSGQGDYAADYDTDLGSLGPGGLQRLGNILDKYKSGDQSRGDQSHADRASGEQKERMLG